MASLFVSADDPSSVAILTYLGPTTLKSKQLKAESENELPAVVEKSHSKLQDRSLPWKPLMRVLL